jgi:hypothetical protein
MLKARTGAGKPGEGERAETLAYGGMIELLNDMIFAKVFS